MRDRKRVYDAKNIARLEIETVNFFRDNVARFGPKQPQIEEIAENPEASS